MSHLIDERRRIRLELPVRKKVFYFKTLERGSLFDSHRTEQSLSPRMKIRESWLQSCFGMLNSDYSLVILQDGEI